MVTVVGQCVGADRYDEANRYMLKLTGLGTLIISVFSLLYYYFSEGRSYPFSVFRKKKQHLLPDNLILICAVGATVLFSPGLHCQTDCACGRDVKFTMIVAIISIVACPGRAWLYLSASYWKLECAGIWYGQLIDWLIRAGIIHLEMLFREMDAISRHQMICLRWTVIYQFSRTEMLIGREALEKIF
jgi:Na+-driven multidrug efflux pump